MRRRVLRLPALLWLAVILLPLSSFALTTLEDSLQYYQLRYGLRNVFDKRVDNQGNGYEALYGVRNFRTVLSGVVYRGGANNAFNRNGVRHNSNPLPNEGLQNLCEEGFDQAVYLYPTRYNSAPKSVSCRKTKDGSTNTLRYSQISPLAGDTASKSILKLVNDRLNSGVSNPLYVHCWNGWHASGYISTLILRQFCGVSAEDGVAYWNKNTDGVNKGASYDKIRAKIRAFQPYPEFSISKSLQSQLCIY
jgi:hypothetical protein